MRVPIHPTLIRRSLQSRLKRLASSGPILAASLCSYSHRCGQLACRCHQGGPLHMSQHVTFKESGKTRSVYVPKDLLPEVRTWIARHRRTECPRDHRHPDDRGRRRSHHRVRRTLSGRPPLHLAPVGALFRKHRHAARRLRWPIERVRRPPVHEEHLAIGDDVAALPDGQRATAAVTLAPRKAELEAHLLRKGTYLAEQSQPDEDGEPGDVEVEVIMLFHKRPGFWGEVGEAGTKSMSGSLSIGPR